MKQYSLQVSGEKATLVARVLCYVRAAQQILKPEGNDATASDSELQSRDSEHSYEAFFVPDTHVECAVQKQVKDSGIFTVFVGGG